MGRRIRYRRCVKRRNDGAGNISNEESVQGTIMSKGRYNYVL